MTYPPEVLLLAKIAKPLGDPARMKILRYLHEHGDASLPNLLEYLRLHPKKVDEHLRLLKRRFLTHPQPPQPSLTKRGEQLNLVDVYPGPNYRIYVLNEPEFRRHMQIIGDFFKSLRHPGQKPNLDHQDWKDSQ